jgi:AraC-like DNA-binding protein
VALPKEGMGASTGAAAIPMVRASALTPFIEFLERIGAPIEPRLAEVKLPSHVFSEPESLIPLNQRLLFLERVAHVEGMENLGVLVGRETHLEQLGNFGKFVLQSFTLHDAVTKVSENIHLYCSAERIWLDTWGDQARFCHAFGSNVGMGRQYAVHFALMLMIDCIRLAAGARWLPAEIHLENSLWDLLGNRFDIFGGIPMSRQKASGIVFDRKLLRAPLECARQKREELAELEYQGLIATAPALDFPDSVQQLVRMYLRDGHYQIPWIANVAGISVRTLQRRLAEEQVDYTALVDGARFDMAVDFLKDGSVKLIDIALELGYSDAASFTRAFRRWTGVAPSEFYQ